MTLVTFRSISPVLLSRVTDRSWLKRGGPPPPEYVEAMFGLDAAVRDALGADWSPAEIVDEVRQLCESHGRAGR